ncbi:MAG: hypothetical protein V1664_02450 [Candidatus Uhrbacteria bacterium]
MKNFKFVFVAVLFLLFLGFGCSQPKIVETPNPEPVSESLQNTVYTDFVINTHDWVLPEQSAATLNKIIDLHEKYQIPVDIFLDDQITQAYNEQYPELLTRLKTSPVVAVSYHLRPPTPYYWDWDWLGLEQMDNQTLYNTIKNYEEHRLDLITGQPTKEPGGYQFLKDLMSYPPFIVSGIASRPNIHKVASQVWQEKGATFTLKHEGGTAWGEKFDGLWLRPEDLEVKVYEFVDQSTGEKILIDALIQLKKDQPTFLNLKWHENNFYSQETSWRFTYGKKQGGTNKPPFDVDRAINDAVLKSSAEQNEMWQRYEDLLIYVKNHPEIFTAINARNLVAMSALLEN